MQVANQVAESTACGLALLHTSISYGVPLVGRTMNIPCRLRTKLGTDLLIGVMVGQPKSRILIQT